MNFSHPAIEIAEQTESFGIVMHRQFSIEMMAESGCVCVCVAAAMPN